MASTPNDRTVRHLLDAGRQLDTAAALLDDEEREEWEEKLKLLADRCFTMGLGEEVKWEGKR